MSNALEYLSFLVDCSEHSPPGTAENLKEFYRVSDALARAMVSEEAVEKLTQAGRKALRQTHAPQANFDPTDENIANMVVRAALEALAQLANPDQDTRGET
jgi:hypothetical protein